MKTQYNITDVLNDVNLVTGYQVEAVCYGESDEQIHRVVKTGANKMKALLEAQVALNKLKGHN